MAPHLIQILKPSAKHTSMYTPFIQLEISQIAIPFFNFPLPVVSNQPGVALVSGYSKNLMTLFLEDGGADLNSEKFMEKAIAGEEYGELVVLD